MRVVPHPFANGLSWKSSTGREELIGAEGVAVTPVDSVAEGMIRIHGELWRAIATGPVVIGKTVRVIKVEGLLLHVEPIQSG